MAPASTMFSYFRGHKRVPSDTNPIPPPTQQAAEVTLPAPNSSFLSPPRYQDGDSVHSSSPVSPVPPILPPIPRVSSRVEDQHDDSSRTETRGTISDRWRGESPESPASPDSSRSSFGRHPESTSREQPSTSPRHELARSNFSGESLAKSKSHTDVTYLSVNNSLLSWNTSASKSSTSIQSQNPPSPPPSRRIARPKSPLYPSAPAKTTKTKLNLRNPMSLLLRRRTSQAATYSPDSSHSFGVPAMPDDFDPGIRGKGVHDFSAPRSRRNYSSTDMQPLATERNSGWSSMEDRRGSAVSGKYLEIKVGGKEDAIVVEKQHTPLFTEHFDDDIPIGSMVTAGAAKTPDVVEMPRLSKSEKKALPPFARNLPDEVDKAVALNVPDREATSPTTPEEEYQDEKVEVQQTPRKSKTRSRGPSLSDRTFQPSAVPRHMKSDASRFSFDMSGMGSSAQEKVLEEKHREKARARFAAEKKNIDEYGSDLDDDYMDDYDYDDDDAGFEEKIPGVNAADDEDEPTIRPINTVFDFQLQEQSSTSFPLDSTGMDPVTTPRDATGDIIGLATSGTPVFQTSRDLATDTPLTPEYRPEDQQYVDGLGLVGFKSDQPNREPSTLGSTASISSQPHFMQTPPHITSDEDDLYFDDGIIDLAPDEGEDGFDESWFDDEADHLLVNPRRMAPRAAHGQYGSNMTIPAMGNIAEVSDDSFGLVPQEELSPALEPLKGIPVPSSASVLNSSIPPSQDKLSAYHSALVAAANAAAASGKFSHRSASSPDLSTETDVPEPGLIADDGRPSTETGPFSPDYGFDDDLTSFNNLADYDLDDDPIIAAANAEALANDEEGFYGQEFNFYATGSDEATAGGYFGTSNSLLRSQSGRVNGHAPNLTPITERSESSNRNSVVSLSFLGNGSSPAYASPGLAQLQGLPDLGDEDLSLSALLKLRRGAFGGSNPSLRSSSAAGSPAAGSPLSQLAPAAPLSISTLHAPHHSPTSSSSSLPTSPTLRAGTRFSTHSDSGTSNPSSPIKRSSGGNWKKPHSRPGSGTDSISYVREEDEDGEERWVLEKRRMSLSGEMEVIGRELVEAGRI